ncbi:THO complex subunit 1-like isoform X2 [Ornithodoros turicata]
MADTMTFSHLIERLEVVIKRFTDGSITTEDVVDHLKSLTVQEPDNLRQTVDQACRNVMASMLRKSIMERPVMDSIVSLAIALGVKEFCSGSLPVLLLSDMFDNLPLKEGEKLFSLVEDKVSVWKEDIFFSYCKNQLLRTCNDLLRRLSRSQNTVFCGRILVFLAKIFPLSERSGLNVISEFNADNITLFSSEDYRGIVSKDSTDDGLEEGEMEDVQSTITVDYNLYRKFWSLQEYFRQPTLCYSKVHWRQFSSYSSDVLSVFGSFKLDDVKSGHWALNEDASKSDTSNAVYFAKYLTSQKLLELELSDSNFRRYVLVQFLILFQYLQSTVRFKQDAHVLNDEQSAWVKNTSSLIYKMLEETPPDGEKFASHMKHILQREESWNTWKNEGCPNFREARPMEPIKEGRPKRRLGDEIKAAISNKKILLGNAEMNRLWNLCPDNWEACASPKRDFVPSLEKFFESAVEQADPNNGIENRYKHVYQSNYGWRSLRLLSQKSPHFFTSSNQPIKSLPLYLESMVLRLAKEMPLSTQHAMNNNNADDKTEVADYAADDSEDELLKSNEDSNSQPKDTTTESKKEATLSTAQLNTLAASIGADWKKLAPLMKFSEDEIIYLAGEHSGDVVKQAHQVLLVWSEQEPDDATASNLQTLVDKAGLKLKTPIVGAN